MPGTAVAGKDRGKRDSVSEDLPRLIRESCDHCDHEEMVGARWNWEANTARER